MNQQLIDVARFGIYYNPASKHYGQDGNVTCDKCHAGSLTACIGLADKDLCLPCAHMLNKSNPTQPPKVIKRGQFGEIKLDTTSDDYGDIRTLMERNEFD